MLFLMAMQWVPEVARSALQETSFMLLLKMSSIRWHKTPKKQSYFDDLHALTKAGVLGYSYRFADFKTDAQYLSDEHQVSLTIDEFNVVKMLLLKRADVGVLNNIAYQYFKRTTFLI
ncbi:hypothetical protein P4S68_19895 [Pseudoalteromonas sp. Hal099]